MARLCCIYAGCKKKPKPGGKYCYGHAHVAFVEKYGSHVKGRWKGRRFKLIPWQRKVLMEVYGNVDKNGHRKVRFVWIEVPKKSGKSEMASILAIDGVAGPDNEQSPEVYCAAGDIKQAGLVFDPARIMVKQNRALKKKLRVIKSQKRIINPSNDGFLVVLSSEVFTKHGLNPSLIIFDEIHSQPTDLLWRVLTEETDVAREQQLVIIITTAGEAKKEQIGYKLHLYAKQVADGVIKDPSWYA